MLIGGKVDWELKLPSKGKKAAWKVGAGDWSAVPSVKQKKDSFHSNPDQIALVCHNFKALVKITIFALSKHMVVMITQ